MVPNRKSNLTIVDSPGYCGCSSSAQGRDSGRYVLFSRSVTKCGSCSKVFFGGEGRMGKVDDFLWDRRTGRVVGVVTWLATSGDSLQQTTFASRTTSLEVCPRMWDRLRATEWPRQIPSPIAPRYRPAGGPLALFLSLQITVLDSTFRILPSYFPCCSVAARG